MFRSAMSIAFHSRSLSLPVALAACSRMAGLNLKNGSPTDGDVVSRQAIAGRDARVFTHHSHASIRRRPAGRFPSTRFT